VGGRVLRYCSISVQSRALLPATCTTWFLSTFVDILVPDSCCGYRYAAHRARVFYFSACAAHPACCLSIGIMPIQAQSSHIFAELSDYHTCCKTPDYKYWMPTLVKEITVLQKMDWLSLHHLQLAKFYKHVCGAIMFTSLNSTINRSQAVISLNALCSLVFELQFVVSRLLRQFQVGILWVTI